MSAVLTSATPSVWPPLAPALEARFEPMTPERLDAVLAIEQSVYSHPWTRGNFADTLAAGHTAPMPQSSIVSVAHQRVGHCAGVGRHHQGPGVPGYDELGIAADSGGEHRQAAGHGFENGVRDAFGARR